MSDSFENTTTSELFRLIDERALARTPGLYSPSDYSSEVTALLELERRGFICAREVLIGWDDDDRGRVQTVSIVRSTEGNTLMEAENVRGAGVDGDWMRDPRATPAAVFLEMAGAGFHNPMETLRAMREFSNIIECGWARELCTAATKVWGDQDDQPEEK